MNDERHPVMKFRWYDLGNGAVIAPDVDWAFNMGFKCFPANFFVAQNAVHWGLSISEMDRVSNGRGGEMYWDDLWKEEKVKAKAIVKALNKAKIRVPEEDQEETILKHN